MTARESVRHYLQGRMEESFEHGDLEIASSFHDFLETVEHMSDEEFEDTASSDLTRA